MKFTLYAHTNNVGSKVSTEIEIEDEWWKNATDQQKEEAMLEEFWNAQLVEWGWEEIK